MLRGLESRSRRKEGLAKNLEHWGVGQLGRRLTSTHRIEKSRHFVDRVKAEAFGLLEPGFTNEVVGCEPFQGLEPSGEGVGGNEVSHMLPELSWLLSE
jgi:hypothetical protein